MGEGRAGRELGMVTVEMGGGEGRGGEAQKGPGGKFYNIYLTKRGEGDLYQSPPQDDLPMPRHKRASRKSPASRSQHANSVTHRPASN